MRKSTSIIYTTLLLVFSIPAFSQISEGFETVPLTGWTQYQTETDDPGFVQTTNQVHTGANSFYHNDNYTSNESTSWMVSPAHTCGTNDELIFWYYQNFAISHYNYSGVLISTSSGDPIANPGDFTVLEEFNSNSNFGFSEDTWTEYSKSLIQYSGQTIYIAFKYVGQADHEFYIDDFSVDVGATCPDPIALTSSNISSSSAAVNWTVEGNESEWSVEYGVSGFLPGTGTVQTESSNNANLNGLQASTEYDVYVRAICGPGDTSDYSIANSFRTDCLAQESEFLCESFDSDSGNESCWKVLNENNDDHIWDLDYSSNTNSGDQVAAFYSDINAGNNDDYLISPNVILTGNEVMKFSYRVQSAWEPNDFQVLLSTTGFSPADFTDTLMELDEYDNTNYKDTAIDLSMYTGNVYVAFHIPPGGLDGWRLYIDDVCFDICVPTPGIDGEMDYCMTEMEINLNEIITSEYSHGIWTLPGNEHDLFDDSLVNVSGIPQGRHEATYVINTGCDYSDTTLAVFNIYNLSSAGMDGTVNVCQNEPINLFEGLSGNVDLGGTWFDYQDNQLSSSQPTAPQLPGSFNFRYYTDNGVCPEDTALLVINVANCDYLSIDEEILNELSIYPNPAKDRVSFTLENGLENEVSISIIDLNGKLVYHNENSFNGKSTLNVDLANFEKGLYIVKVKTSEIEKSYKLVKQ